jgi:predicted ATPase/class 3 adenylate cyclase
MELPTGTVTFLFSDIAGSTKLLQRLGGAAYATVLFDHHRLLRQAWADHEGIEIDTAGDGFFVVFAAAPQAVAAAAQAQYALAEHVWPDSATVRVRMGLHTGTPQLSGDRYVGIDVHRAARIMAAAHGGQILLSQTTHSLVEDALPDGATLRDLGACQLKDLLRPERLAQLVLPGLSTDFPPLKTLDVYPNNLPIQPTALLGREEQVAALCSLLRREDVRLVTLTGPGGIGKTRLAIQVAAELVDEFADGVWFVSLSRLTDSDLVLPTVAQTLGLRDQGGAPLVETLREYLRARQALLVLDNCEQVVAAAPAISELLAACPGVKALATSRAPLHLLGEREYALRPLALPDGTHVAAETLAQYAAVALFIERAQAAQADFTVTNATAPAVAAICARLDGVPLAIVLAAARVKLLPPPALLQRLERSLALLTGGARDLDARQQTMRATLAWSYDLLAPEQQALFRRLAVFVGGWTLAAAEAVCGAPDGVAPLGQDLLEGLSALVDQSLVQRRTTAEDDEPRFSLLYVIREFALEQLTASGEEEALRQAHAAYYTTSIEQWWAAFHTAMLSDEVDLERASLDAEQDNLRAVLARLRASAEGHDHAAVTGRPNAAPITLGPGSETPAAQGLRLAGALLWPWAFRGRMGEGRAWLETFLTLATPAPEGVRAQVESGSEALPGARLGRKTRARRGPVEAFMRARALYALGVLAYWQGDADAAAPALEQSLAIVRTLGDRTLPGVALARPGANLRYLVANNLGMALKELGAWERAQACYEESLAVGRTFGTPEIAMPLANLAALALATGDLERAAAHSEEALAEARQHSDPTTEAGCLIMQALIASRRGRSGDAMKLAREALTVHRTVHDERHYGDGLDACAIVRATQGDAEGAARLLGAAAAARERIGMRQPMDIPAAEDIEEAAALTRAALGAEAWAAAFAAGQDLTLEQAIAEALGETRHERSEGE